jgi:hypothetical protein
MMKAMNRGEGVSLSLTTGPARVFAFVCVHAWLIAYRSRRRQFTGAKLQRVWRLSVSKIWKIEHAIRGQHQRSERRNR